jgi:hypothetical protein
MVFKNIFYQSINASEILKYTINKNSTLYQKLNMETKTTTTTTQ